MSKRNFTKRILTVALSVIMVLGLMPMTAFADGTYTFPSLSQSGDNNSTLRYYLTDENAGVITINERTDRVQLYLDMDGGWYFEKWDTYFNGYKDRPILSDPEIKGSNPVSDDGYYTFYNVNGGMQPFVNNSGAVGSQFIYIAKGTGFYGDHSITAVLKPILTVNAGEGVSYQIATNNPSYTNLAENQVAVKYGENATVTYTVDGKYVVTDVSANYGTDYSESGTIVTVNAVKKPATVTIHTRLKQHNVVFDANGGEGTMSSQVFEHSVAQTLTENNFTKTGYTFAGWNTKADGTGTAYTDKQSVNFTPANDGDSITLYAQWKKTTEVSAPAAKSLTYNGTEQELIIAGTTSSGTLQYALGSDNTTAPTDGWNTDIPVAAHAGAYNVWYKVVGNNDYSDVPAQCITAEIKQATNEWETEPFISGWTYGGTASTPTYKTKFGTVSIKYSGNDYNSTTPPKNAGSYTATFTVTGNDNYTGLSKGVPFTIAMAEQIAPSVCKIDETISQKSDGKITNVYTGMEFRADGEGTYTAIFGTEITDLAAGKYYVRWMEECNHTASSDVEVIIGAGRMLTVTIPVVRTGYELKVSATELDWHGSTTLTFTLKEGYEKSADFAIKVNGEKVELDEHGICPISEVNKDLVITVEGVVLKTYTVTYTNENGTVKTVEVEHGKKPEIPEPPAKDGYTVTWEKVPDAVTDDITIKAVYTEIPATGMPSSPNTGDNSHMTLLVSLLFISGGALIILTVGERKRKRAFKNI